MNSIGFTSGRLTNRANVLVQDSTDENLKIILDCDSWCLLYKKEDNEAVCCVVKLFVSLLFSWNKWPF